MNVDRPSRGGDPHSDSTVAGVGRQPVRLRVQIGADLGRVFTMSGNTLSVGRAQDNDVSLEDPQVSRYHARLSRKGNTLVVEDLGSTNGTLVNGRRISGARVLQPTETLAIGATVFSVEGFDAPNTMGVSPVRRAEPVAEDKNVPATPWLVIGGVVGLVAVVLLIVAAGWLFSGKMAGGTPSVPYVFIQSPVAGSQAWVGQTVYVNAVASDATGVTHAELWVAGTMVSEQTSAVAEGQPTFPVNLSWTPATPGNYTLEVRAFNSQGTSSAPTTVMVVVGEGDKPSPTPTPSGQPTVAGPTPGGSPVAVTTADLNVREGPGQVYKAIALLSAGAEARITGKNAEGTWWQIEYPSNSGGRAWVYAAFTRAFNEQDVPVVEAPPLPTATGTSTPVVQQTPSAAVTPTATQVVVAPTATPSPTSATGVIVEFSVDQTAIGAGTCVNLQWHIENVSAAYLSGGEFNNVGVTGPYSSRSTCPTSSTTYILRVEAPSGRVERSVTVNVTGAKSKTLDAVDGTVREDGKTKGSPMAGDDDTNQELRAFLGYDLSSLAGKTVVNARLDLSDFDETGDPFDELGDMFVEEVDVPSSLALDKSNYSASVRERLARFDGVNDLDNPIDVTARVNLYTTNHQRFFLVRIRFDDGTNDDGVKDNIEWDDARLVIYYRD